MPREGWKTVTLRTDVFARLLAVRIEMIAQCRHDVGPSDVLAGLLATCNPDDLARWLREQGGEALGSPQPHRQK